MTIVIVHWYTMSRYYAKPPTHKKETNPDYTKELSFVKEPPEEISIECPSMSTDNVKRYITNILWPSFLYFMHQKNTWILSNV